jgi:hypothetical protein
LWEQRFDIVEGYSESGSFIEREFRDSMPIDIDMLKSIFTRIGCHFRILVNIAEEARLRVQQETHESQQAKKLHDVLYVN